MTLLVSLLPLLLCLSFLLSMVFLTFFSKITSPWLLFSLVSAQFLSTHHIHASEKAAVVFLPYNFFVRGKMKIQEESFIFQVDLVLCSSLNDFVSANSITLFVFFYFSNSANVPHAMHFKLKLIQLWTKYFKWVNLECSMHSLVLKVYLAI